MPLQSLPLSYTETAIHLGVILLVTLISLWLVQVAIRRVVAIATNRTRAHLERLGRPGQIIAQATGSDNERQSARARTIGTMLRSAATLVIVSVALLTALADLGINLAPVLTTAGVGGVALAFGAQSLVKDVLSGIFLVIEDQYGVGDQVKIGDVSGSIEEVALRVTTVRDGDGRLWYLRNGEITKVANISQGWSMATVDVLIGPDEDPTRAAALLQPVCEAVHADPEFADQLVEVPSVLGVEQITPYSMTLRLSAKCVANQQWGVQRALLARAKRALDEAGIAGPHAGWTPPVPPTAV